MGEDRGNPGPRKRSIPAGRANGTAPSRRAEAHFVERSRALRVLTAAGRSLVRSDSETVLLEAICRVCVEQGEYPLAWVGYRVDDDARTVRPVASASDGEGYLDACAFTWGSAPARQGPVGRAIRLGETVAVQDLRSAACDEPWCEAALERGYAAAIALPLVSEAEVFGVLAIFSDEHDDFDPDEVRLLGQLADDLAYGIRNLRSWEARQRAETQLRESHDLLEQVFANVHMLLAYVDRDFNFIRVNRAYAAAGGHDPDWFVGRNHFTLYPDEEKEAIFRRVLETGEPYTVYEKPFTRPDRPKKGVTYWDWSLRPVVGRSGKVTGLLMALIDVTERRRQRDAAMTEHRRLERGVLEASQAERRRVGRDLHDSLGQVLAALSFRSQNLARTLGDDHPEAREEIESLTEMIREAIRQTRAISRGLNPVEVKAEGLADALHLLAEQTSLAYEADCTFVCPRPVLIDCHEAAGHLYRLAQEAVSNAMRHGRPSCVQVRLEQDGSELRLVIEDDGDGLPAEAEDGEGMGLRVMKYRAELVGGRCEITARPEGGTRVVCSMPFPVVVPESESHGEAREQDR